MTITPLEDPDEPLGNMELAMVAACALVIAVAQMVRSRKPPTKMHLF